MAVQDTVPFAASLVPFSLAIGSTAASSGLDPIDWLGGTLFLLAGASQLGATELLASGAAASSVVAAVALINFRLLLYGAGIGRWFAAVPLWQRLALAAVVVDQNYLLCQQRFEQLVAAADRRRYYLTVTACLITVFVGCQTVGYLVGAGAPASLGLHLAAPLAFVGMLARSITARHHLATAATAVVVIAAIGESAGSLALPLATVTALFVGSCIARSSS